MIKNIPVLFAAAACLAMVSCDSPSDYRPGRKTSVNMVPPGERSTYNVSDAAGDVSAHDSHGNQHDTHGKSTHGSSTLLNHDEHVNDIKADTSAAMEHPTKHINNPDSVGIE